MHVIRANVKTQTFISSRVDRRRQEQDVVSLQHKKGIPLEGQVHTKGKSTRRASPPAGQVHTTGKSTPALKWPIKTFIVRSFVVVLPVMSSSVKPSAPVRGEEEQGGNGFSLFPSNPAVPPRGKGKGWEESEKFPFSLICSRSALEPSGKCLPRVSKSPGKACGRPSNVSPEE